MYPHTSVPLLERHQPQPHETQCHQEPLQVTINEAGRLLAYDARTIRRLIVRGELPAVGQGRLRRVPMQSLREYQQRNLIK